MATFITSKAIGETLTGIYTQTSTGYWKYNHDGIDSSVFANGPQVLTVTNANGEFTIIPCDVNGIVNGDITVLAIGNRQLTSFDGTGLTGLTYLELRSNQLITFDATSLSILQHLDLTNNPLTPVVNNQILNQLNQIGLANGTFKSNNGRTAASNTDYDNLLNNLGWYFEGLDLVTPPVVGSGRLAVRGVIPTPPWNGGVIYNIGAVVTHEGQTWHCIRYAPAGYGPFGGYIDVYWTL